MGTIHLKGIADRGKRRLALTIEVSNNLPHTQKGNPLMPRSRVRLKQTGPSLHLWNGTPKVFLPMRKKEDRRKKNIG